MAYQALGLGSVAGDGTGDTIRGGGDKINDNFVEIYTLLGTGAALTSGISATASVVTLAGPSITGVASFADGSVSAPAITNTGDSNTGIYFSAGDTLSVTTGGTKRVDIDSSGLDVTGAIAATTSITAAGTMQGTTITAETAFVPDASDGAALGTAALEFSDLFLANGGVIYFGADQEVTLTHIHDTGLRLNSTYQLQFNDASQYIYAPSATVLALAGPEIELNATLVDVNANLDVSGTLLQTGVATFAARPLFNSNITVQNGGYIGSAGASSAIAIAGSGVVTFAEVPVFPANSIAESNLHISNNPTNGYMLTAQSGNAGGLTWVEASGGGSATNINGLSDALIENNSIWLGSNPSGTTSTAEGNVALGIEALDAITTGDNNIAIGFVALTVNTTGEDNTAVGRHALYANTEGNKNIAIGYGAGQGITTGDNNTIIGDYAGTTGLADTVVITAGTAERIKVTSTGLYVNETLVISSPGAISATTITATGNVGIGETTPLGKVHAKVTDTGASANSVGNLLVLEDSENGMSILSSTAGAGYILFGDSGDNDIGGILYGHSDNTMKFRTNGDWNRMVIDSSGNVGINDPTPASLLTVKMSGNGYVDGFRIEDNDSTTASAIAHVNGILYLSSNGIADSLTINAAQDAVFAGDVTSIGGQAISAAQWGYVGTASAAFTSTLSGNITTNNAKVTNATHTGHVTGSGALTIANDVINSEHYAAGSVDATALGADAVTAAKIGDNVINSEHYAAGSIDAEHLNVTGNGTTSQFLKSDSDGSFTWAVPADTNTNTTYSAGSGLDLSSTTFSLETDLRDGITAIGRDSNDYISIGTTSIVSYLDGTARLSINNAGALIATGDITAFGSISDIRLKENIEPITGALNKVLQIGGYTFNYKKTPDVRMTGVIAQEVEKVLPEVIYTTTGIDNEEEHLAVRYDNMIGLLVEAIKELKSEIEELKRGN